MHRKEGFTLIELMIVILIIAILVAIAIPVYLAVRENAMRRTCQANLRTIDGAINTYLGEYEAYPPTGLLNSAHDLAPFLRDIPLCPRNRTEYILVGTTPPPRASCQAAANHTYSAGGG